MVMKSNVDGNEIMHSIQGQDDHHHHVVIIIL